MVDATLIMQFICEVINLAQFLKLLFTITLLTRCTIKTDKYATKLNGTILFVKRNCSLQIEKCEVHFLFGTVPRTTSELLRTTVQ